MRIDKTGPISGAAARGAARSASGPAFNIDMGAGAGRAGALSAAPSVGGIETLLALQAAGDPRERRRRAVSRGRELLDTLDQLRSDLLVGRLSEDRIDQLLVLLASARDADDPGLDAVLDDIELRARVELAKRGRYPSA